MKLTSLTLIVTLLASSASAEARGRSHYYAKRIGTGLAIGVGMMAIHHYTHRGYGYNGAANAGSIQPQDRPYPDLNKTPGDVLPVSSDDICVRGYTKQVRNVSIGLKREVYAQYGLEYVPRADEVDHLISLELGGSNDLKNLWPEPYNEVSSNSATNGFGAHQKDLVENKLHGLVCSPGTKEQKDARLKEAQYMISHDWIAAYKKYIGRDPRPDNTNYGDH